MRGAISSWAIHGPDGWVLVESGPESCWPRLESGLQSLGIKPEDLKALLLTHIHLDHAGGAWRLAERGVPVHVHEFGARHLIDPSKLVASATRIYGDSMSRLWGQINPCDGELVHGCGDGCVINAAGLQLRAVETPGHAAHHHAWSLEDEETAICFSGDAAAMLIPETPWISIPMPPPEFDLEAWHATIDRLEAGNWNRMCLTHGGSLDSEDEIEDHLKRLREGLDQQVEVIQMICQQEGDPTQQQAAYRAWLLKTAEAAGIEESQFDGFVSTGLLGMNLMGVRRYLDQKAAQG